MRKKDINLFLNENKRTFFYLLAKSPKWLNKFIRLIEFFFLTFLLDKFFFFITHKNYNSLTEVIFDFFNNGKNAFKGYFNLPDTAFMIITFIVFGYIPYYFYTRKKFNISYHIAYKINNSKKSLLAALDKLVQNIIQQEEKDKIKTKDDFFSDILNHAQSEFNIENVDTISIQNCNDYLSKLITGDNPKKVTKIFALTDFSEKSWLTRLMLIYLIRTIQIADKIPHEKDKKRIALIEDRKNLNGSFETVKNLHRGFMQFQPITKSDFHHFSRELNITKKIPFLYLEMENNEKVIFYLRKTTWGNYIWEEHTNNIPLEYKCIIKKFFKNEDF